MEEKLTLECSVCGQAMVLTVEEHQELLRKYVEAVCPTCERKGEGVPVDE